MGEKALAALTSEDKFVLPSEIKTIRSQANRPKRSHSSLIREKEVSCRGRVFCYNTVITRLPFNRGRRPVIRKRRTPKWLERRAATEKKMAGLVFLKGITKWDKRRAQYIERKWMDGVTPFSRVVSSWRVHRAFIVISWSVRSVFSGHAILICRIYFFHLSGKHKPFSVLLADFAETKRV